MESEIKVGDSVQTPSGQKLMVQSIDGDVAYLTLPGFNKVKWLDCVPVNRLEKIESRSTPDGT